MSVFRPIRSLGLCATNGSNGQDSGRSSGGRLERPVGTSGYFWNRPISASQLSASRRWRLHTPGQERRSRKRSKADVQLEVRSEPVIHVGASDIRVDRRLCSVHGHFGFKMPMGTVGHRVPHEFWDVGLPKEDFFANSPFNAHRGWQVAAVEKRRNDCIRIA
jgi:hypothetical protein